MERLYEMKWSLFPDFVLRIVRFGKTGADEMKFGQEIA
jgi:hypothetical protein